MGVATQSRKELPVARVERTPIVMAGLVGALLAAMIVGLFAYNAHRNGPFAQGAFTSTYHQRLLDDPLEQLLVQGDGQAYATIARDPTLSHPEVFGSDEEAAYRMQRPLLSYLAWTLSFGQSGWVPPALALIAVGGSGFAVAGVARLLRDRGAPSMLAPVLLLMPGAYISLRFLGVETLALALASWGLIAWSRERRPLAIALFIAAALTRESLLLVPAAVALDAIWHRRVRDVGLLTVPPWAFLVWVVVVRVRVGAWCWEAGQGRIGAPFVGLIDALRSRNLNGTGTTLTYAALFVVLGLAAVVAARRDVLALVVATNVAFATTMGKWVWQDWGGFGRVLLPLGAFALVALAGRLADPPRESLPSSG